MAVANAHMDRDQSQMAASVQTTNSLGDKEN